MSKLWFSSHSLLLDVGVFPEYKFREFFSGGMSNLWKEVSKYWDMVLKG